MAEVKRTGLIPGREIRGLGTEVFSTGQVAAICNCAPRIAARWMDTGQLRSFKLPNHKGKYAQRRAYRDDLLAFLRANGFHEAAERLSGKFERRYLLYGCAPVWADTLLGLLTGEPRSSGIGCDSLAHLGFEAAKAEAPTVLLAAVEAPRRDVLHAGRWLVKCRPGLRLIGLLAEDDADHAPWWDAGFTHLLRWPCDPAAVAAALRGEDVP